MGAKKWGKTTRKEIEFCRLYVLGDVKYMGNATECYKKIYGCESQKRSSIWNYASRLMKKKHIKEAIQELQTRIDKTYILIQLKRIAEDGDSVRDRLKALELLGKSVGVFNKEIRTSNSNSGFSAYGKFERAVS